MTLNKRAALAFLVAAASCPAARLSPAANQEFEAYAANLEARLARQHGTPETCIAGRKARPGELRIQPVEGGRRALNGALLHHWRGTTFVPGTTSENMLALLQDYNHLPHFYAPEIESAHALRQTGGLTTLAMRLRKREVLTVVLDAEYQVRAGRTGAGCGYSVSRSTHVWQVDEPGTPHERRREEGDDDGFLWRLNSYWSFLDTHAGLLIECEAISLTRDIPVGLGWLVEPIVADLPRASLELTLQATRKALANNSSKDGHS